MGVVAFLPLLAFAQQGTGTITGRVTETGTALPVADAQVVIVGTTRGARTDAEGRYRITDVPAGQAVVRALRIGYSSTAQNINVAAGGSNTADFALSTAAISLDRVLVTATGSEQRRVEVGNAVSNIEVEDLQKAAIPNGASLLQARAPGVTVIQNGGTTGTSARVRIRGANSINLSNEPLLIIDNVRVNNSNNSFSIGTGGQSVSRLNDLDPDEIESIDILKGPAASALYGTAAANGVIQVTTKRGRSGKATYSVYGQTGSIPQEPGPIPIWLTLLTSMFMHGGWLHIGGNMLFLWVFGDNVEHRMGRLRYVVFYVLAGVIGSLAQILVAPDSTIPTLGASGAISGVLGAYLVLFPRNRVTVFLLRFITQVPALVAIGLWAALQIFSGISGLGADTPGGGVAYFAHIGGLAAGIVAGLIFRATGRGSQAPSRPFGG
jgi:TonB-dependent SusC/RagA subfamily outer membrane receptor